MKMFSEVLLLVIIIIVLLFLFFYYAQILSAPSVQQFSIGSVCLKNRCFITELAKTEAQRERGLMYVKELDKNKGMLFVFDKEGIYPFWMKNTLIPLDMIWIKEGPSAGSGQVVFISENVQPCKSLICPNTIPTARAKYVLEVNAGIVEEIGLMVGDELKITP
jgi:hypothetical protein